MNRIDAIWRSRRSLRQMVSATIATIGCAVAVEAWAQGAADRDGLAHELVAMAAADVKAGRPSRALFRIAQAERLDPSVRVPDDVRRALKVHRISERKLIEQGERALRERDQNAVRKALEKLARADARNPAALELMLHANADLTRLGWPYHRHTWFAQKPAARSDSQSHASKEGR